MILGGGRGLLGWVPKLPWSDPSVAAQLLSMLVFMLGGLSGLVNASYTMNLVVHNTSYIPGHFHLTVGTAVALSIMGIFYWMIPHLTGRALWGRRIAVLQAWLWFFGEERDQKDGQLHLSSVAWCAFALMEYRVTHTEMDDRPPTSPAKRAAVMALLEAIAGGASEEAE